MPRKDIEALIRWRDATADNYGDELICKILYHLSELDVPEEHRAAQAEFKKLSVDAQYRLIAKTVGEVGEPTVTRVTWDYEASINDIDKLRAALEPLGVHVYRDPYWPDPDEVHGFIFSLVELNAEDIAQIGAEAPE